MTAIDVPVPDVRVDPARARTEAAHVPAMARQQAAPLGRMHRGLQSNRRIRVTDQRSEAAKAYRHLYNQARWKGKNGRRAEQLKREPLCRMCQAQGRITPASVADHIIEHKGDETLFWGGELQSLCKAHHDGAKQAEEKRGVAGAVDLDGWPLDPRHEANRSRRLRGGCLRF